jgi:hypothetical protein
MKNQESNKEISKLLELIKNSAEEFSCGGIGEKGPTQAELDLANEEGRPVDDNPTHHNGQQIWLYAQKAINLIENKIS